MELSEKQYQRIAALLPTQRGNVKIENRTLLNALIYRCENGCKWRALPKSFGNWHVIYMRWVYALDSTAIKVHPDAQGALKKTVRKR
ncbi:hypothetical protein AGMMS49942_03000 [Spirochaetia bacterium]|nr:hypothetical protein AGMMS49942_03000 [Spirochaetia bacterium]